MGELSPSASRALSDNLTTSGSFEELQAALLERAAPDLYRLLAALFAELSRREGGQRAKLDEQLAVLNRQLQELQKKNALLDYDLTQARDEQDRATKQFEIEQGHTQKLKKQMEEQRAQMGTGQKDKEGLERQLVAVNERLHQLENENEQWRLRAQRAEQAAGDTSRLEKLEEDKRRLGVDAETARKEADETRRRKDEEIERLKKELETAKAGGGNGKAGEAALNGLWQRLATTKPPLIEGHIPPTVQAAERLFDGFIALVRFAHELEQSVTPFLNRYTTYNPALRQAWNAYTQFPGVEQTAKKTVAVQGGMPAGVLNGRLRQIKSWALATLLASDDVIHQGFILEKLQEHLNAARKEDPKRMIKDYLQEGGAEEYYTIVKKIHSERLFTHFGHGGAAQ